MGTLWGVRCMGRGTLCLLWKWLGRDQGHKAHWQGGLCQTSMCQSLRPDRADLKVNIEATEGGYTLGIDKSSEHSTILWGCERSALRSIWGPRLPGEQALYGNNTE
jgi:hypothetical protein